MQAPMLTRMLEAGFVDLGTEPGSEVVVGAVGRFWSPSGNLPVRTIRTREDFKGFAQPGYSKAAMNFLGGARGDGASSGRRPESSAPTPTRPGSSAATGVDRLGQRRDQA